MSFNIIVIIISYIIATLIHKKLNLDYNSFLKNNFNFKKLIIHIISFVLIFFIICIPLEFLYELLI